MRLSKCAFRVDAVCYPSACQALLRPVPDPVAWVADKAICQRCSSNSTADESAAGRRHPKVKAMHSKVMAGRPSASKQTAVFPRKACFCHAHRSSRQCESKVVVFFAIRFESLHSWTAEWLRDKRGLVVWACDNKQGTSSLLVALKVSTGIITRRLLRAGDCCEFPNHGSAGLARMVAQRIYRFSYLAQLLTCRLRVVSV